LKEIVTGWGKCAAMKGKKCHRERKTTALNAIKFLANRLRISIVSAGTHEALHVMHADPQIASRFEQLALLSGQNPRSRVGLWPDTFALLPIKRSSAAIDKRFQKYLLELSEGVTGRIIDVLRRAALQGIADKTQKVGLVQLQVIGAKMPSVVV
jgi:hypothetical protein